jgi:hypothetical protein
LPAGQANHGASPFLKSTAQAKRRPFKNIFLKAKQSKAKQSKAKQSKAKQSKAKQSKAKQSKAKQSKAELAFPFLSFPFLSFPFLKKDRRMSRFFFSKSFSLFF